MGWSQFRLVPYKISLTVLMQLKTLYDEFAMAALSGLLPRTRTETDYEIAERAYQIAKVMMVVREDWYEGVVEQEESERDKYDKK